MFKSKNKKILYTSVNPNFPTMYINCGARGYTSHGCVILMELFGVKVEYKSSMLRFFFSLNVLVKNIYP